MSRAYRAPKPKPQCVVAWAFLNKRLGRGCLAPCTGQDRRALEAWFHLVELYGVGDYDGERAAVIAMAAVLGGMQQSVWHLAKASIPGVLDWGHEEPIWRQVHEQRVLARSLGAMRAEN